MAAHETLVHEQIGAVLRQFHWKEGKGGCGWREGEHGEETKRRWTGRVERQGYIGLQEGFMEGEGKVKRKKKFMRVEGFLTLAVFCVSSVLFFQCGDSACEQ